MLASPPLVGFDRPALAAELGALGVAVVPEPFSPAGLLAAAKAARCRRESPPD